MTSGRLNNSDGIQAGGICRHVSCYHLVPPNHESYSWQPISSSMADEYEREQPDWTLSVVSLKLHMFSNRLTELQQVLRKEQHFFGYQLCILTQPHLLIPIAYISATTPRYWPLPACVRKWKNAIWHPNFAAVSYSRTRQVLLQSDNHLQVDRIP